jgi:hypothetical protein
VEIEISVLDRWGDGFALQELQELQEGKKNGVEEK